SCRSWCDVAATRHSTSCVPVVAYASRMPGIAASSSATSSSAPWAISRNTNACTGYPAAVRSTSGPYPVMMPALSNRCRRDATVARATLANRDSSSAPARGLSRISLIRSTSRASSGVGTSDTAAAYYDSTVEHGDFPVQNLPYGVFSTVDGRRRVGAAIGDRILDLSRMDVPYREDFEQPALNTFMARGRTAWEEVRAYLTENAENAAGGEHTVTASGATLH